MQDGEVTSHLHTQWIEYLDTVAQLEYMTKVKREITERLELREGYAVLDAGDVATTRAILQEKCRLMRHGWIGRQLSGLMREAGLEDITALPPFPDSHRWAAGDLATRSASSGRVGAASLSDYPGAV